MYAAHDALLCISDGSFVGQDERRRVTPEHWFKPAKDMRALFADLPEACDNTLAIARMCAVMAEAKKPELPVSPKVGQGMTEAETVRSMAAAGLRVLGRLNAKPRHARVADASDPLHAARAAELTSLWRLGAV